MKSTSLRKLAGVLALAAALATACGGEPPAGEGGEGGEAAKIESLKVMTRLYGTAPKKDGELHKAVEKFLGTKLDITWVPDPDYQAKFNATMASDELPDLLVADPKNPAFVKAAEAGAFWDLTEKLDRYPNLATDPTARRNASVNGKDFGVYRTRPLLRSAVIYRKDWLKKLGLELPETTDDLYKVAKAFTEDDPDGNGKDDTYGIIFPKWPTPNFSANSPYNAIDVWFGAPNGYGMRDGKLVPEFDTPEFYEANRYMKKLVDEGLTNPDFASFDSAKWNDAFAAGKGGIIVDVNVRTDGIYQLMREEHGDKSGDMVAMTGNLAGPDGQKFSLPFTGHHGIIAISKQRIQTEPELDAVLELMNKLASKEGSALLTNGIEGRNYKLEDGFAVPIDQDDPEVKEIVNDYHKGFIQLGTSHSLGTEVHPVKPETEGEREVLELRDPLMEEDLKTAVHDPTLPFISQTQVEKGPTLNPMVTDARIKYLAGQITEEELKAEVQRWYDSGGTQVIEEFTQLINDNS